MKADLDFQVDVKQMERCERVLNHLAIPAKKNEIRMALMDKTFDHAADGDKIADKLTVTGTDKAGLLKFADGAYVIADGSFRAYTRGDYVCQQNTNGHKFPGRDDDGSAMTSPSAATHSLAAFVSLTIGHRSNRIDT